MKTRRPNLVALAHAAMARMPAEVAQGICDALETLVTELEEMAYERANGGERQDRVDVCLDAANQFGLMAEFLKPKPTEANL